MKDASQYAITELYGCQPDYPLNKNLCQAGYGFHRGVDYGCPTGTPVIVNGTQIGLSGATGAVTGPHLHVGHWSGGNSVRLEPGDGFKINSTTVLRLGHNDPTNGNYVHVGDADGSYWVYLHLSRIDVEVGQELKGDEVFNEGDRVNINVALYGADTGAHKEVVGMPFKDAVYAIFGSAHFEDESRTNDGDVVNINKSLGTTNTPKDIIWKKLWYDYASQHLPSGDHYEKVDEPLYRKKP